MSGISRIKKIKRQILVWWRLVRFWLVHIARHIKVWLGLGVWARDTRPRPKTQRCKYCGKNMTRGRKTPNGAFYYCKKCNKTYHVFCYGKKLVQL